jgi:hypothetical protein
MSRIARKVEALVQLAYPVTNAEGYPKADEAGRYVNLHVRDSTSGETLIDLELSAVEWTQILAGQFTRVPDGAGVGDLSRVGLRRATRTVYLDRVPQDEEEAQLAAARTAAEAEGWEFSHTSRTNRGVRTLNLHRWEEPDETPAEEPAVLCRVCGEPTSKDDLHIIGGRPYDAHWSCIGGRPAVDDRDSDGR